ncbi:NBS type disease resistance protein [Salix suchowensis]|nr:NBS type disease resistance protein [Salix suchowensis]
MAEAMIEALGEQLVQALKKAGEYDILTDCLHRAEYQNEGFTYFKTIGQQSIHDDRGSIGKWWTSPVYDEYICHIADRFEKRVWVSVSQTVNEEETMKSVLKQLEEDGYGMDMNYLIVMDDDWSAEGWWDRMCAGQLKREGWSSCIIMTTGIESVVIEMGEAKQPLELEEAGKFIVKKCHGLPLAIKTIGGLLKSKVPQSNLRGISSLEHLSCLNLRGVSALKELPFSIGKFHNLQVLVLSRCKNLQKLPLSITACRSSLLNLQELSGFMLVGVDKKDDCQLAELQNLLQLRVLRVHIREESEIAEELAILSHLKQLRVFSINIEGCDKEEIHREV